MRSLFCLLLLCLAHILQAQYVKSYIPPSPNAASLGQYGQVPVSEYSGIPEIKIPLDSIDVNGFTLPLSLSYHAGGFRRSDEASWTGLGWSLQTGGVITRSKRHKDDFGNDGFFSTTSSRPCGEDVDQEPDMFYYNFNGKAGKFIILGPSATYKVRTFTRDNLKIEYNNLLATFTITTGEGIIYRFETVERTTETTVATAKPTETETFISTWFLSSIELVNGTRINFTYLANNNTKISKSIVSGDDEKTLSYSPTQLNQSCCAAGYDAVLPDSNRSTTTLQTNEVILSRIDFPNGAVQFYTSSRTDLKVVAGTSPAKKLDSVQLYAGVGNNLSLLNTFALTYDYYSSGSGNATDLSTRLRLLSIREKTPQAAFKPFIITYPGNFLPDKTSGFSDYLGTAGLLQSIIYPTGGSIVFIFETHSVAGPLVGARIQKIYARDPADSLDVRRFEYIGGKVMGKIMQGLYFTYTQRMLITDCCGSTANATIEREQKLYTDFSSLSETINGYIVGYDQVITWLGENGENGKIESFFENTAPADPDYHQGRYPVPVPLNTSIKNGLLKEQYQYRNNNGTFVPVHFLRYIYNSTDAMNTTARRYAFDKCDWTYTITTEWVRPTSQVVYNYEINGANPVSYTTQFYYDDAGNALPTRTLLTTDSKGKPVLTTNTYVKQKSTQQGGIYTTMLNKNMISILVDQEKTRDGLPVSKSTTQYRDWYNNGKILLPETIQLQKGSDSPYTSVRYHAYNESGDVVAQSKEAGSALSYIWAYGDQYPIAEITNADPLPITEITTNPHNVGQFLNLGSSAFQDFESFTTNYAQTYSFSVRVVPLVANNGSFNGRITLRLMKVGSQLPLFEGYYYSNNTFAESVTLPSGTGTYYFSVAVPQAGTNTTNIRLDITSSYKKTYSYYSYFHTSFEELTSNFVMDGRTGKKSHKGGYAISLRRPPGKYILSWWQKSGTGGDWIYNEQLYNITAGETNNIWAGGGIDVLVDEVRFYPQFAKMTTYTWQPGVGMITRCDERNQVTTYEYDELNRLRVIRDHNNNILKTIEYNYKN